MKQNQSAHSLNLWAFVINECAPGFIPIVRFGVEIVRYRSDAYEAGETGIGRDIIVVRVVPNLSGKASPLQLQHLRVSFLGARVLSELNHSPLAKLTFY